MILLNCDNNPIKISNPDKLLWPELGIKKIDYINHLIALAPYILKHAKDKLLTVIRYPDGIDGKAFFQKHMSAYTPNWVEAIVEGNEKFINLNSLSTLIWLGSLGALEFHVTFNIIQQPDHPSSIVFDLDPSAGQDFEDVTYTALLIKDTLDSLGITSLPKISGASGIQIYIPVASRYTYEEARLINEFFGSYFSNTYSKYITIERIVNKRDHKIYFDYLQMWRKKSIISGYSPRATKYASVSTPITWDILKKGCHPRDFTLFNIVDYIKEKGDLFEILFNTHTAQNLDFILDKIKK